MPSWAYLVVLMFVGLLAWPAFEGRVLRTLRRLRRRLRRGRSYRNPYAPRRAEPDASSLAPPTHR